MNSTGAHMNKITTLLLRQSAFLLVLAVLAVAHSLSLCKPAAAAPAPATVDIDLPTAYAADNFQTRNLQQFADEVRTATEGRVNIRLDPGGRMLKPAEIFSGVRDGKAHTGEVIMSSLEKEELLFGMDSLPFIVSGYEDARRMWAASRPAVEKSMDKRGLLVLYAVPWPPQNLYSAEAVETIRDFSGRAMRVYNPTTERMLQVRNLKVSYDGVLRCRKSIWRCARAASWRWWAATAMESPRRCGRLPD